MQIFLYLAKVFNNKYNIPMKKVYLLLLLILCGCQRIVPPDSFVYQEIQTDIYRLASWQKIMDKNAPIHIYLEGDGNAFNHRGRPTSNPTPHGTFLREIAFNDPNDNVIYLARPCQYVSDEHCNQTDWTTGRFSQDIINATALAIKDISQGRPIFLIGYSGGALLSGLVINQNPTLPVKKWITLAGVLNHTRWTENLKLPPLIHSLDLERLPTIPQLHLIGDKDKIVPYQLTESLVDKNNLIIIPNATHNAGFEAYLPKIYANDLKGK